MTKTKCSTIAFSVKLLLWTVMGVSDQMPLPHYTQDLITWGEYNSVFANIDIYLAIVEVLQYHNSELYP
jgi:hypothetical protein